ncbi:MAG: phage integrase family protein, partial [Clostridiales bacterium]|nr:phage integrase family protein [Clostridiales bacterium]
MKRIKINTNDANRTFNDTLTEFIRYCSLSNLSQRTIEFYEETLQFFSRFISNVDFKLNIVNKSIIEEYTMSLKASGIKNVSINTRLRGVRAFTYWCIERGYIKPFKINLVKQEEIIKETYTDDEIKILLVKPDIKKCSFTEYRDWVVINFLIGTGVRLSTLTAINIGDI